MSQLTEVPDVNVFQQDLTVMKGEHKALEQMSFRTGKSI